MSFRGAPSLGIGSMIGAGIFALFGPTASVAGPATWVSFLLGAVVATLLLSAQGGSSGSARLAGVEAWLTFAGLALVMATAVAAFGSYAGALAGGWGGLFATALIAVLVAARWVGLTLFGRPLRGLAVAATLGALGVVLAATLPDLDRSLLFPPAYPSVGTIVAAAALTAFGYLAFLAGAPNRLLGGTAALYAVVAAAVCGTLTSAQVSRHGTTAIAEAVRPAFGETGFTVVAAGALLATAIAAAAALTASVELAGSFAETGLMPRFFASPQVALGATAAVVFLMATAFGLSTLVAVGSGVALIVFLLGALGATRRRLVAAATGATVLVFFAVYAWGHASDALTGIVLVVVLAFVLDYWTSVQDPRDDLPRGFRAAPEN